MFWIFLGGITVIGTPWFSKILPSQETFGNICSHFLLSQKRGGATCTMARGQGCCYFSTAQGQPLQQSVSGAVVEKVCHIIIKLAFVWHFKFMKSYYLSHNPWNWHYWAFINRLVNSRRSYDFQRSYNFHRTFFACHPPMWCKKAFGECW